MSLRKRPALEVREGVTEVSDICDLPPTASPDSDALRAVFYEGAVWAQVSTGQSAVLHDIAAGTTVSLDTVRPLLPHLPLQNVAPLTASGTDDVLAQEAAACVRLSLLEALYYFDLLEIHDGAPPFPTLNREEFSRRCENRRPWFRPLYRVYRHFRDQVRRRVSARRECLAQGWYVRSGVLYGGDFVIYERHPEHIHAGYSIRVLDHTAVFSSHDLQVAYRLSHQVNKGLLLAVVDEAAVTIRAVARWVPSRH